MTKPSRLAAWRERLKYWGWREGDIIALLKRWRNDDSPPTAVAATRDASHRGAPVRDPRQIFDAVADGYGGVVLRLKKPLRAAVGDRALTEEEDRGMYVIGSAPYARRLDDLPEIISARETLEATRRRGTEPWSALDDRESETQALGQFQAALGRHYAEQDSDYLEAGGRDPRAEREQRFDPGDTRQDMRNSPSGAMDPGGAFAGPFAEGRPLDNDPEKLYGGAPNRRPFVREGYASGPTPNPNARQIEPLPRRPLTAAETGQREQAPREPRLGLYAELVWDHKRRLGDLNAKNRARAAGGWWAPR